MTDHWQVIENALEAHRKYVNATHLTFDMVRVERVKELYAALAFVRKQRAATVQGQPQPGLREALAEYAHDAWSGWMKYLFEKCDVTGNTYAAIPVWAVRRWRRQMNTPYADLPEEEKQSDREEADKMLAIMTGRPQPADTQGGGGDDGE